MVLTTSSEWFDLKHHWHKWYISAVAIRIDKKRKATRKGGHKGDMATAEGSVRIAPTYWDTSKFPEVNI